jgi:hypothetical protein
MEIGRKYPVLVFLRHWKITHIEKKTVLAEKRDAGGKRKTPNFWLSDFLGIKVTSFMPFFSVLRGAGAIQYPTSLSFFVFRGQSASKRLKTPQNRLASDSKTFNT